MARRKLEPATELVVADLGKTPEGAAQLEASARERQLAVIERYGDGLPWQPDHYETAIQKELQRGCDAFLRAGRYLIVANECAAHGEWTAMLDRLGMKRDQAWRMMESARRVGSLPNVATSQRLLEAANSQGKLIELLSLPEQQFAELAEGSTEGLTLDDVEKMTVRELRAAVREARADLDAKDERAAKREREIEKKTAEIQRLKKLGAKATPDEVAQELREAVNRAVLCARAEIGARGKNADGQDVGSLAATFAALIEHGVDHDQDHADFLGGAIGELMQELRKLRDLYTLPIVNDAQG